MQYLIKLYDEFYLHLDDIFELITEDRIKTINITNVFENTEQLFYVGVNFVVNPFDFNTFPTTIVGFRQKINYFDIETDFENKEEIEKLLKNPETRAMGVMLIKHQIGKKQNS